MVSLEVMIEERQCFIFPLRVLRGAIKNKVGAVFPNCGGSVALRCSKKCQAPARLQMQTVLSAEKMPSGSVGSSVTQVGTSQRD